jgi:hypothetical protein
MRRRATACEHAFAPACLGDRAWTRDWDPACRSVFPSPSQATCVIGLGDRDLSPSGHGLTNFETPFRGPEVEFAYCSNVAR